MGIGDMSVNPIASDGQRDERTNLYGSVLPGLPQ